MRQYTNEIQTAKLIELVFREPFRNEYLHIVEEYGYAVNKERNFTIGELIEMLEEFASVVISYSYQKNGYYVRVIIPKREGGGMYRISQIELIDALYDMIVKLKEEGVI